jgi:hypothetical protein
MRVRIRTLVTSALVALALCLFSLRDPSSSLGRSTCLHKSTGRCRSFKSAISVQIRVEASGTTREAQIGGAHDWGA